MTETTHNLGSDADFVTRMLAFPTEEDLANDRSPDWRYPLAEYMSQAEAVQMAFDGNHEALEPCEDCGKTVFYCETCGDYFHVDRKKVCFLHQRQHVLIKGKETHES